MYTDLPLTLKAPSGFNVVVDRSNHEKTNAEQMIHLCQKTWSALQVAEYAHAHPCPPQQQQVVLMLWLVGVY